MSKRLKVRPPVQPDGTPMLPKAERRELGRKAAVKRLAARRRREVLRRFAPGGAVLGVIVVVVLGFLLIGRDNDKSNTSANSAAASSSASPSVPAQDTAPTQIPIGMDPKLSQRPEVAPAGEAKPAKLLTTTLIEGKGAPIANGQSLSVNYVGATYAGGAEFDASWSSGHFFSFVLGGGNVIKGWDQGLVGVKVGSRVQIDIPSELAYGDAPPTGYPAGPLRFIIDVLSAT